MTPERTLDKYYNLTADDRSDVGNADPEDSNIHWDYFEHENTSLDLSKPLRFKINKGKFSGKRGDFQINSCGFVLCSHELRTIIENYLTEIDGPRWFPATVTDLEGITKDYSILNFFKKSDFLDHNHSTFVPGTDHPIKKRFDLDKIGERLIFNSSQHGSSICVHDIVRKEITARNCSGIYFYKIHTAGRLV